jgi:hypothetical protein
LASPLENMGVDALRSNTEHIRELRPHSVAVIVGQFIADPIAPVAFRVDVSRNASGQFPATVAVSLTNSGSTYVLVPLNDASQFVSGTLNSLGHSENIVAADITDLGNFAKRVTVNISRVSGGFAAGINTVRLTIRLKAINSWAVGWAYNSFPVIYLNMRDPNTGNVLSATQAEALMVHELGHKLHLAASGAAQQPDQQAHHYPSFNTNGVSHMGPHCSQGVAAGTNLWTSAAHTAATCTMWGALKQTTQFCDECKTSLRKVHLGSGF